MRFMKVDSVATSEPLVHDLLRTKNIGIINGKERT